jgi:integrase
VQLLREHMATLPKDPDAFVFPGRQKHTTDRQQSYHGFRCRFRAALRAAGLADVTPHDFRACARASWVADSHGVLVSARRLGHANASVTTRHYARAVDGRDTDVAKHLDASRSKLAKPSGTQRARKPRNAGD